ALIEPGPQHIPGLGAVLVLGALGLTHHRDACRDVGEAHRRLGLVDVLPAGAARPHGVSAHVGLLDLDDDTVVDNGIDRDAGEGGVPTGVGVERRDAHEAMHAVLALEPAISIVALHLDGGRLDAGLFAGGLLQVFDLVAVLLGPARVHAQQHIRPVLALSAAGAGVDFQV